jgi:hypothetical protein
LIKEITHTILRFTHSDYKPDDRKDFVALFCPDIDLGKLVTWLSTNKGRRLAEDEFHLHRDRPGRGLVRNRRNFLHCGTLLTRPTDRSDQGKKSSPAALVFPMTTFTVNLLPFEQARLGLFIPAVLQHVELLMVASELCKTVLKEVRFRDPYHPIEAIH